MAKTNTGLVAYAKAQLGRPYWYGCFGQTSSAALYKSKKAQYPAQYQWDCKDNQPSTSPAKQLGVKVHDCVGLIKGYLWCASANGAPTYKASQDVSANGMLSVCKKKGKIETIPDIPGVLVFLPGHVGVYIGGGYVIEARGHRYGVVKTALKGRGWTDWGYCPYIEYVNNAPSKTTVNKPAASTPAKTSTSTEKTSTPTYKVGQVITTQVELNVRKGAGTNHTQKKRTELTADGQKHAKKQTYATLLKGTGATVQEVKKVGNDIWVRIPSGWIAAYYGGKIYAK